MFVNGKRVKAIRLNNKKALKVRVGTDEVRNHLPYFDISKRNFVFSPEGGSERFELRTNMTLGRPTGAIVGDLPPYRVTANAKGGIVSMDRRTGREPYRATYKFNYTSDMPIDTKVSIMQEGRLPFATLAYDVWEAVEGGSRAVVHGTSNCDGLRFEWISEGGQMLWPENPSLAISIGAYYKMPELEKEYFTVNKNTFIQDDQFSTGGALLADLDHPIYMGDGLPKDYGKDKEYDFTFSFDMPENPSEKFAVCARLGVFAAFSDKMLASVVVKVEPGVPMMEILPTAFDVVSSATTKSLMVTSNGPWRATSNATFVTLGENKLSQVQSDGSGALLLNVESNRGRESRAGGIYIQNLQDPEAAVECWVTQRARGKYATITTNKTGNVSSYGGNVTFTVVSNVDGLKFRWVMVNGAYAWETGVQSNTGVIYEHPNVDSLRYYIGSAILAQDKKLSDGSASTGMGWSDALKDAGKYDAYTANFEVTLPANNNGKGITIRLGVYEAESETLLGYKDIYFNYRTT